MGSEGGSCCLDLYSLFAKHTDSASGFSGYHFLRLPRTCSTESIDCQANIARHGEDEL